uniref:Reverse transcriptase Ty1/copia-type domain-containing protein n=1 Tax=Solanum lycopersicum TaxID=4081 RepID=A0A3Q7HMV9_SOLLC
MSPLEPTVKLKANEGALLKDPTFYRKLVGKLNFLTNTRLDITFSVQHLSQFLQSPREPHLKAAYHVPRYIMNDPCLEIFLSNSIDCTITAYCDSDWAACPDSRRSVSGYIVLMGDSPICWKSKKQATISLSSAEAEYRAIRKVVGELVWLERQVSIFATIKNKSLRMMVVCKKLFDETLLYSVPLIAKFEIRGLFLITEFELCGVPFIP